MVIKMKYDLQAIRRKNKKLALHLKRKAKIRKIVFGTKERPRLSVFKSAKHIYVQAIDDSLSATIASVGSLDPIIKDNIIVMDKILLFIWGIFILYLINICNIKNKNVNQINFV